MAVRAFHSLIWLLCCWLSSSAGLGTSRSDSVTADSVNGTAPQHHSTLGSLHWMPLPQSRLIFEDRTPQGRPIPGLAKNSRCCGIVNNENRIVNGTATKRGEFPWMAALVEASGQFINGTPLCGGALINDRYVLTAAHCVRSWPSPQWGQVILGKHEVFQTSEYEERLAIDKIIIHPRYSQGSFLNNDIALLRLKAQLSLSLGDNRIAPICLPSRSIFNNEEVELAGFGSTVFQGNPLVDRPDTLHKIKLRVVRNRVCAFLNAVASPYFVVQPNMMCALGTISRTGACQGDSGSPLMVAARYRKSRRAVLGLTSWGIGCAEPLSPSGYVRVPWFLDWIIANTRDAEYC